MGHTLDDNGVCTKCGFDAADAAWQRQILRDEIGIDEYIYRVQQGEFAWERECTPTLRSRGAVTKGGRYE